MTTKRSPIRSRLLIIEPDDLMQGLIVRWLAEAGYRVATNDSPSSNVALVIVDVPNPAHPDAALQSLGERYGVPILAISGRIRRDRGASERAARRLGVARMLPKPFTCADLLAAVRECLPDP